MINQAHNGLASGRILGQRFKILRLLGQGGMAMVYLAQDLRSGRQVAVKVLKEEFMNDEEFLRRFDTEAKAASSLNHPSIVKVLGVGEEDGVRYMIQEYVEGTSLKDMIDHYGRLDWRIAVPIGIQIALALEHAHNAGIIHRDIKPHNILITPERKVMVTDFGIARAGNNNTITLAGGNAVGSVHYFSPEQARGGMVGASADIYSLGILFYEMLTGDVPFDGESSVAVAIKHLQEQAVNPCELCPDIPAGLGAIVMKCIRKSTRQRYASARELINELDAFLLNPEGSYGHVDEGPDVQDSTVAMSSLRPESRFDKVRDLENQIHERKRKRHRDIGIIVTVVLLGLALLLAIFFRIFSSIDSPNKRIGGENFFVGNYVGMQQDDVLRIFQEKNFSRYRISAEVSADQPAGVVIKQDPAAGVEISPNGLKELLIVVSEGADSLKLAPMVGFTEQDASKKLMDKGYHVIKRLEFSNEIASGKVIGTDPAAGTVLKNGDTVELIISKGPKDVQIPGGLYEMTRVEAEQALKDLGLTSSVEVPSGTSEPPERQYVISSSPEPGSLVPFASNVRLICGSWADIHPSPTPEPSPTPTPEPTTTPSSAAASPTPVPDQPAPVPPHVSDKTTPTGDNGAESENG